MHSPSSALAAAAALACLTSWTVPDTGNVLVVIMDDTGVDRVGAYAEHPDPGNTPNLDRLAAEGILFRNFYVNMVCSPTRAAVLTGRYGFRTGIGTAIKASETDAPGFPDQEWTLPEVLPESVTTAAIGKWHLASPAQGIHHPVVFGFDTFTGALFNPGNYYRWPEIIDGRVRASTEYTTTAFTDRAIQFVESTTGPWFLWLAYNAAHKPLHVPPGHLHRIPLSGPPKDSPTEHHKAAVEAMDEELGRLLASVDLDTTTVIFLSDNGTVSSAVTLPFTSGKPSPFEGGINTPLIVAGRGVVEPGRECDALVGAVDLFRTVTGLLDADLDSFPPGVGQDSISIEPYLRGTGQAPLRRFAYSEFFQPNFSPHSLYNRSLRDQRWKLIRRSIGGSSFFDLERDPFEAHNLLSIPLEAEQQAALDRLSAELDALLGS